MNTKPICIYGTGGFARELLTLLTDLHQYDRVAGFVEPDAVFSEKYSPESRIMGKPVLPESAFDPDQQCMTVGVGSPAIRRKIVEALPAHTEYPSFIHPSASVSRWVSIGPGAVVCAGCILTAQIEIGRHCHLNLQTTIGHDCYIGDYFTTAPGVHVSGDCRFGDQVYFGTGSATRQGIRITSGVTIGMGAMVVKPIDTPGTYVGIPAKKIK